MNKKLLRWQIQCAANVVAILMSLTLVTGLAFGQNVKRIVFNPNPPFESQMEELKVNPSKANSYVVKLKKGQTITIILHDDTKKLEGDFNASKFSSRKEFKMKAIETRDYYFGVRNPTTKALTYALDITVE
jgi:phosphoribosylformylglycinamidine (FGAM) synthase-like amidotransferase family enzyme